MVSSRFYKRPVSKSQGGEEGKKMKDINLQPLSVNTHGGKTCHDDPLASVTGLGKGLSQMPLSPSLPFWISSEIEAGEILRGAGWKVGLEFEPWASLNYLAELGCCQVLQDAKETCVCQLRAINQTASLHHSGFPWETKHLSLMTAILVDALPHPAAFTSPS